MSSELGWHVVLGLGRVIARRIEKGTRLGASCGCLVGASLGASAGFALMQYLDPQWWWYLLLPGGGIGAVTGAMLGSMLRSRFTAGKTDEGILLASPAELSHPNANEVNDFSAACSPESESTEEKERPESSANEQESHLGKWRWAILVTVLGFFFFMMRESPKWKQDPPKTPQIPQEVARDFESLMLLAEEVRPLGVKIDKTPKPGERDEVEVALLSKLEAQKKEGANAPRTQRTARALEYWRERKKRINERPAEPWKK